MNSNNSNENQKKVLHLKIEYNNFNENQFYDYRLSVKNLIEAYIIQDTYLIKNSENKIIEKSQQADIKPEDEFLFRVFNDNNDNYTLMNFIPNNLEYNDENSDFINKKIWYVLRPQEIKNNEKKYNEDYYLKVNDIIKMGKMKFVVQKICIAGKNENDNKIEQEPIFNLIYRVGNNLETYDKNECIFCPDTKTQRDKISEDFLTSLCKCNIPNIHYNCAKIILNMATITKDKIKDNNEEKNKDDKVNNNHNNDKTKKNQTYVDYYVVTKFTCSECGNMYPIRFQKPNSNEIYHLIDIKEPTEGDYMILESLENKNFEEYVKYIYVIKLNEQQSIYIGRNILITLQ